MLQNRRKLPRIFGPLLVALSISTLPAPHARAAQVASPGSSAQKSPLDAPARELARRIAASLPGGTRVEIEVRNQSSLSEDDASALRATLADEMSARGLRTSGEGPGAANVVVTLSENVQGYVWVAQIQHGDDSSVLLQSVPRESSASAGSPESEKIVLRMELLWSGPAHVLDALELPATGSAPGRLLLLELDGITAVVTDSKNTFRTELPVTVYHPRDAQGEFAFVENALEVDLPAVEGEGETCNISVDGHSKPECARIIDLIVPTAARIPSPSGDEVATVSSPCGGGDITLAAGKTDYTQPDAVLTYAISGRREALSEPVTFAGPVTTLSGSLDGPVIAVTRTLQDGNYEVYRITASCGQ